ncbi:MAG: hypothetical protein JXR40_07600 [Pontiellaceae bacterium]|nr:hypothetical protein [Pontiellaceae bacterium]
MNISTVTEAGQANLTKDQAQLKEACNEIEGMFLNILLKQGMQEMLENTEGHSASALAYSLEQTASEIARKGDVGVAENIYQQLSANL